MTNSKDREFLNPFPRPFLMNALPYLTTFKLSPAQQKEIISMNLDYFKNCALEEIKLIKGIMGVLNNLEEKG
ncbi:MAG: hypothetical protein IH591_09720 [Bacteroidales bacterium]|nr:hypothetical protein [Bacteroidales bacterium]